MRLRVYCMGEMQAPMENHRARALVAIGGEKKELNLW